MTRDARFIQQLESYLDDYEGATTLPDRVREAVRAELPKTKQAGLLPGPARYLTMFSTRTAQVAVALAAAALIVAVGAFLYAGRDVGGPDGPPSRTTDTAPSSSAEVCEATAVNSRGFGAGTVDVVWCAYGVGEPRSIAFAMQGSYRVGPDQAFAEQNSLWLRPPAGGAITLALFEEQSVEEVVSDVTGRAGYDASDPTDVTLGGAAGVVFDVALAEGAASSDAAPLIADPNVSWRLQEGTFTRVWIVDLDGDTVMFAAGEELADAVGESLSTIEWGS